MSENTLAISDAEAWQLRSERRQADLSVSSYLTLALAAPEASDIYQRLVSTENMLIPQADYVIGSARYPDEIMHLGGNNRVLLTAEHATEQRRNNDSKEADFGTGALAYVAAQATNSSGLIPMGRQTGDANYDPTHHIKDMMVPIIQDPANLAHLSLHLLWRGRTPDPRAELGHSVIIGVGGDPSEATKALADEIIEIGKDLGLRVGVNIPHINFRVKDKILIRDEDGSPKTVTFAAKGPNTTRTHAQAVAAAAGKDYATMQLEINEALLVRAGQELEFPSKDEKELGAYGGFVFTARAIGAVAML